MVESNDIIEIKIVSGNKSLYIGSSSDCNNDSSTFFDKLYFIGEKTFEEVKDFESALLPYVINGKVLVISID